MTYLMRVGRQPFITYPARVLERIRLPSQLKKPMADWRVLVLSPFAPADHRASKELAMGRNLLVAALLDGIVFAFIAPVGHLEELCRVVADWGIRHSTLAEAPAHAG